MTPLGVCQCGCAGRTKVSPQTDREWGYIKGVPRKWLPGHERKWSVERFAENFWRQVSRAGDDSCWEWQAARTKAGYGRCTRQARAIMAHRMARTLTHGEIPPGFMVLHRCDNPPCCNPSHLWLGTGDDNMADMVAKGRAASGDRHGMRLHPEKILRGERHGSAKLTPELARAIRVDWKNGATSPELAQRYNISRAHAWRIGKRLLWTD